MRQFMPTGELCGSSCGHEGPGGIGSPAPGCGGEGTCIYVCFMVQLKILFFAQKFTNVWISAKIQIVFVSLIYPKTGFVDFLKIQQTTFFYFTIVCTVYSTKCYTVTVYQYASFPTQIKTNC